MAYYDISVLSGDNDFIQRTRACASTEHIDDPVAWSTDHMWEMASMPGFGDAYSSAIVAGIENPGRDQSVISDSQILSAVQAIVSVQPITQPA